MVEEGDGYFQVVNEPKQDSELVRGVAEIEAAHASKCPPSSSPSSSSQHSMERCAAALTGFAIFQI
jgi:hypothetical protein